MFSRILTYEERATIKKLLAADGAKEHRVRNIAYRAKCLNVNERRTLNESLAEMPHDEWPLDVLPKVQRQRFLSVLVKLDAAWADLRKQEASPSVIFEPSGRRSND